MKRVVLVAFGLAAIQACSGKNEAKHEVGRAPQTFTQPDLVVTAQPTNPDGGLILGKHKEVVAIAPSLDLSGPLNQPLVLTDKSVSVGGVTFTAAMTLQDIINASGEKPQANEGTGRTFYSFPKHGFVAVSLAKTDGSSDSNTPPDYFYVSSNLGYKGLISAPEALGKIALGKRLPLQGDLSLVNLEAFTRHWGSAVFANEAFVENAIPANVDCFLAAKCKVDAQDGGSFSISFPLGSMNVSNDGTLESFFFAASPEKAERLVGDFSGAVTDTAVMGAHIAGLTLDSTRAQIKSTLGELKISNNKATFLDGAVEVTFDAKSGLTSGISVTDTFKGALISNRNFESGLDFGKVLPDVAFDCETLLPLAVQAFEAAPVPGFEKCVAKENEVTVQMQGGNVTFAQRNNLDNTGKEVYFARFELKKRPVIYGQMIVGVKLGDTYASVVSKYGRQTAVNIIEEEKIFELKFGSKGPTVLFDVTDPAAKVIAVSVASGSGAEIYNAAFEKVAQLGKADLNFQDTAEKNSSFEAFVKKMDKSFLDLLPALANSAPETRFQAECTLRVSATCSMSSEEGENGAITTVGIGPVPTLGAPMKFEFNEKNVLTKVSL